MAACFGFTSLNVKQARPQSSHCVHVIQISVWVLRNNRPLMQYFFSRSMVRRRKAGVQYE
jgi:hypothetical protein